MKSVGEVMAIGRTFEEALGKAMRSLENGRGGLGADGKDSFDEHKFDEHLAVPNEQRLFYIAEAFRRGRERRGAARAHAHRPVVPRAASSACVEVEQSLAGTHARRAHAPRTCARPSGTASPTCRSRTSPARPRRACARCARPLGVQADVQVGRHLRGRVRGLHAVLLQDVRGRGRGRPVATSRKAMILGAGPNRIGQGIEFDYCCVHAAYALHDLGYETDHGQLQPRDGLDRLRHVATASTSSR